MVTEPGKGPIQSVSRAAAILRCFYDRQELGLQEISTRVGLHKSTTATLVATLKNEQLLEQDPTTSRYRLGIGAFLLGANSKIDLRTLTQPYLLALNQRFLETVNLAVPAGGEIVYIDKIESEYSMRTCTRIGQRLPFYCTANGKAIFAHYSQEALKGILDHLEFQKVAPHTVSSLERLKADLDQVRREGYAQDNEELEQGLCCYAAPIFDRMGAPVAAVSISGPAARMTGERERAEMLAALKSCAAEISRMLKQVHYVDATPLEEL
jgi:IclR family KDG regulon transcriptional repressor